jgi:hypothetical protein
MKSGKAMELERVAEALAQERDVLDPAHREGPLDAEGPRASAVAQRTRLGAVDVGMHVDDPVAERGVRPASAA